MKWWQKAVFYQIYPRSFADGNGDGIGDLAGMISRLDYLKDLGVDAIWMSPHYPSPQVDCGYDVADYTAVAPEYGTLDDFRRFLDGLHERGMYLILDLVLNHTSDQHPWFIESRSSKTNPKRDWYVWHPGQKHGPPNNWLSAFGGSAWEFDETTGEYYYHYFFKEQPDLNWHHPDVRNAMWDSVRFWLDMGVDGFRLDAVGTIFEDPALPDHKAGVTQDDLYRMDRLAQTAAEHARVARLWEEMYQPQHDQPGIHELMQELRSVVDEYPDRVLVGETDDLTYYGDGDNELHMVFNFPLMRTRRLTADWVRKNQEERLAGIPSKGWQCNPLGNHDCGRIISEFGDGQHNEEIARLNLAILLTMKGTPFLYNGEEIGMTNASIENPSDFRDPLSSQAYEMEIRLMGAPPEQAAVYASQRGRDKTRTPMQWENAPYGGFCPANVKPWLPVNDNYQHGVNVHDQLQDPNSLWWYYQRILEVRRENPALREGEYEAVVFQDDHILAYRRVSPEQACLILLNPTAEIRFLDLKHSGFAYRIVYSHHPLDVMDSITLQPWDVVILDESGLQRDSC